MDSYRKTAIIVGVLFIIATVSAVLTIGILGSTLDLSEYLTAVAANETQVILAVIFWLILAISVLGIGVMMYPILKKYDEAMALGAVAFRIIEGAVFMVGVACVLALATVSQGFAQHELRMIPIFRLWESCCWQDIR